MSDTRVKLEKIDQQILDLLEQRILLYREALDDGRGMEEDEEVIEAWVEAGMERGLDETAVERMCRAVLAVTRKGAE